MDNSGKWQKIDNIIFSCIFKNVKAQIKFLHQKKSELQHITRDI